MTFYLRVYRAILIVFTSLFIVFLTSCTTTPELISDSNSQALWEKRQIELIKIHDWKLSGRLAIINGVEEWFLDISWKQNSDGYIIYLKGPFGMGAVQLNGTQNGVTLKTGDETAHALDAEYLLYQKTGVRMPIHGLLYWIRGLPLPDSKAEQQQLDHQGRLKTLIQQDWNIRFKNYQMIVNTELPSKVFIKNGTLDVRLIVDDWSL